MYTEKLKMSLSFVGKYATNNKLIDNEYKLKILILLIYIFFMIQ